MSTRVLIVDDDEQVRDVLRRTMERCGYEVEEAANGKDAIKRLGTAGYDLVILDIIMPERDGLEVLMHLRKHRPESKVIAISAPANELYLTSARGLGAARVFVKPVELQAITDAAAELLST